MRIATNVSAIISNNALQRAQGNLSASIERLSSGYKINSSADDAAGCAISEKMRVQLRGLSQAENNTSDGISAISTAEGAIIEIQNMLERMKELSVQAANDVNSDEEREAIQAEIDQVNQEIDRISESTQFNSVVAKKSYLFDPATGNRNIVNLDSAVKARFVKIVIYSNDINAGYSAQLSEISVYGN